jgi:hypothetical protein
VLTALLLAALAAGVAGAWSPCGFSMVDTLAPHGYARRMRVTAVACAAFAAGALVGGVATFGGLALVGDALGTGGAAAAAIAAAVLLAAAAGDAAGRRIVPQVRRQVPESWRRLLPLPLAAALYGVLLGLGFTTFVLSFAVYALAAACVALGEPGVGVGVGLAFAAGRIVPVVVLAPLQETDRGLRLAGAMGDSPGALRAIRAGGALALAVAAVLALGGAPATAAAQSLLTPQGTDPSVDGGTLAWQMPGGGRGVIQRTGAAPEQLPGSDPALGPGAVVWREGDELVVAEQRSLTPLVRVAAPGAEEPAISSRWLVWRARDGAADVLRALDLLAPGQPARELRRVPAPDRLGRPSLFGDRAVLHVATRAGSRIEEIFVPSGRVAVLRKARDGSLLLNPSEHEDGLLFVRSSPQGQDVLLGPRRRRSGRADRRLLSTHPTARRDAGREPGRSRHRAGYPGRRPPPLPRRAPSGVDVTLWTTALGPDAAYVTRIRRTSRGTTTQVLRLTRR